MSEESRGRGRPSKYDPKFCDVLIEHMSKGLSYESFAGAIGVSKQTLYTWESEYPEFLDAKEIGLGKSLLYWEQSGIKGAHTVEVEEEIAERDPNGKPTGKMITVKVMRERPILPPVWIFNVKNRFGWRDRQPGEADVNVNFIAGLKDDELDAKIAEHERKKLTGGNSDGS